MTDKRYTAVLATLFDSASDATLDYAVSRHNIHKMVFLLSLIAGIGQVAIGAFIGIECTFKALPYVALHGILILLGYLTLSERSQAPAMPSTTLSFDFAFSYQDFFIAPHHISLMQKHLFMQ